MKLYPCPKCDKEDASPDGEKYCGPCEETYQQEVVDFDQLTDANFSEWASQHNL